MDISLPAGARIPTVPEALFSLVAMVVGISIAIYFYEAWPHVPLLFGVIASSVIGLRCGFKWDVIQDGMIKGIVNALPAIIILIVIGCLIGIWILAGVVPTLIYYGLEILSPSIFLPATLIICAITSLATGTSWGTTGTIGVALMGVGSGLGIPLPIVAGAVLSGAYFGDKMSPLSDTTNLAPAMAGTDLFTHIKHMSYTTGVAIALTLIIETVIGLSYAGDSADVERVTTMLTVLESTFFINPAMLLPPVIVLFVSYRKMPAIPGITIGVLAGIICAVGLQGADYEAILNAGMSGFSGETGNADVDGLIQRGGIESMMLTIGLVIAAMMFGGVMERTNQLKVLADRVLSLAKSQGSLIVATVLTSIGANLVLCDQYMAIVMGARTYAQAYRDRGLAPENLSRAVEDSATVTANLVPWNSGGAYQAATLGVATLAYLPFNFFCWLSPIITIIYGVTGFTIKKLDESATGQKTEKAEEPGSETA